jgi:hypothetical protein
MTGPSNETESDDMTSRGLTVRWKAEDWRSIEEAIRALNVRDKSDITPTDFIRMSARRFAAEILAAA